MSTSPSRARCSPHSSASACTRRGRGRGRAVRCPSSASHGADQTRPALQVALLLPASGDALPRGRRQRPCRGFLHGARAQSARRRVRPEILLRAATRSHRVSAHRPPFAQRARACVKIAPCAEPHCTGATIDASESNALCCPARPTCLPSGPAFSAQSQMHGRQHRACVRAPRRWVLLNLAFIAKQMKTEDGKAGDPSLALVAVTCFQALYVQRSHGCG